jgi:hypothetical protein
MLSQGPREASITHRSLPHRHIPRELGGATGKHDGPGLGHISLGRPRKIGGAGEPGHAASDKLAPESRQIRASPCADRAVQAVNSGLATALARPDQPPNPAQPCSKTAHESQKLAITSKVHFGRSGFQGCRIQPLCHPSRRHRKASRSAIRSIAQANQPSTGGRHPTQVAGTYTHVRNVLGTTVSRTQPRLIFDGAVRGTRRAGRLPRPPRRVASGRSGRS